eukprot:s450_g31.t1
MPWLSMILRRRQSLCRTALVAAFLRLLVHALKQFFRSRKTLPPPQPLRNWFVTEFRWPRKEDYLLATSDEMDKDIMGTPAYMALAENSGCLMSRGANMLEGVDAYTSSAFFRTAYGLEASQINLVVWGSPHAELADEVTTSHAKTGPARWYKRDAFQHLCHQYPWSVVVVTYSGSKVESPAGLRPPEAVLHLKLVVPSVGPTSYTPRFSSGWKRAEVVMAVVRLPLHWLNLQWASCLEASTVHPRDGTRPQHLHLWKLIEMLHVTSPEGAAIFLEEERADLSTAAARPPSFPLRPGLALRQIADQYALSLGTYILNLEVGLSRRGPDASCAARVVSRAALFLCLSFSTLLFVQDMAAEASGAAEQKNQAGNQWHVKGTDFQFCAQAMPVMLPIAWTKDKEDQKPMLWSPPIYLGGKQPTEGTTHAETS